MTVFRVNIEKDVAEVVKNFKQDRELVKITKHWNENCAKLTVR